MIFSLKLDRPAVSSISPKMWFLIKKLVPIILYVSSMLYYISLNLVLALYKHCSTCNKQSKTYYRMTCHTRRRRRDRSMSPRMRLSDDHSVILTEVVKINVSISFPLFSISKFFKRGPRGYLKNIIKTPRK